MKSAKKSLKFDFNADVFARRAPGPMKISQSMCDLIGKIVDKYGNKNDSPVQKRHRQTYFRFIDTHLRKLPEKFDTFSRVRRLAQALTYSENELPRIVDTREICYALQLIERRLSMGALRGVRSAFRQAQNSQYVQILGAFLKKYQNGPQLPHSWMKLANILHNFKLPDYTYGYRYFGAVAGASKSISRPCDKSSVTDIVKFAAEEHQDDQTNREILSELIEQLGNNTCEHLRQPIQSYALQNWKEPRIAGANWKYISNKAQCIFTQWIIEKDFYFFFDVIPKTVNVFEFEARKAFWLAYFEYISFCRLVLHEGNEGLFRDNQQDFQYYRDRRPATLVGGAQNQHALIIEIGDYIFVEFSIAPMCYVYNKADRPFPLNAPSYKINELRNTMPTHRENRFDLENDSWQSRLASWIATKLGIKPLRSYRFDKRSNTYTVSEKIKSR